MANCRYDISAYVEPGCDVETGSIVAVAFIDESVIFTDITDAAEWINTTYDADILVHQEVRGSYSKPSPTEVAGKGKQDVRVIGRKHEISFRVSGVKNNHGYWNALNKSTSYKFAFVVGGNYDLLFYVDTTVSIDAAPEVQESLDSEVDWLVTVKWSDIDIPSTSNVPAGIFE